MKTASLGVSKKTKAHEQGKLHRAFSVFILDGQKMLLQQRSTTKYHSGGLWTNACCSHPAPGEPIEEAAIRRCKEELGIAVNPVEVFSFVYRAQLGNLVEYEYDHVFLANHSGPVSYDNSEIESVKWMNLQEVRLQVVENPQLFTTWFFTAFNQLQRFLPKDETIEIAR
ncbi:MAG: isopentenyl-diphosphate Delta-isomerase [Eggerthellaceae bacterium]|nr:isopentenyl-diphosphate Delta-isomerase [Eggerthellaceae bacterium]